MAKTLGPIVQDEEDRENRACVTVCRSCRTVPTCEKGEESFLEKSWTAKMNSTKVRPTTSLPLLTPGQEEPELDEDKTDIRGSRSFALNTTVQETCAKRKVDTKKNIDMLVKVRESPVGGCAKNSSDALQGAWRRVSSANRQNTFLTMKFMNHLNHGVVKTFNLPLESEHLIWETYSCHCT